MKKPIKTNIRFKDYSPDQIMLLPPSLEELIDANHPVRIVNQVIEKIDSQKITDTIAKINEALKDKPVSKKVSQKLKYNKGFKRFILRGCEKVEIEAGLLSLAHNLKKWSC
jgi:transposase